MGHADIKLQKLLKQAASGTDFYDESPPIRAVLGLQGGGSWASAERGALKVLVPFILQHGTIEAASGPSGGAVNATLLVKGLNEGGGAEGVAHYLDKGWDIVKKNGRLFGLSRDANFCTSASDAWPNIPRPFMDIGNLMQMATMGQAGLTTTAIKHMMNTAIGDWSNVRNGPASLYVNSVKQNIFTGKCEHKVFTGDELCADAVAASAALKELGPHYLAHEFMSAGNWLSGNLNRYLDGAYAVNPHITPLLAHNPTDVFVISLHKLPGAPKTGRDKDLYTGEVHYDLTHMQLDDGRRFNLHVLQLEFPPEWNDTSRLNSDPEFIDHLEMLGKTQAEAWLQENGAAIGQNSSYRPNSGVVQYMIESRQLIVA